jgi:hypothetical protein
MLRAEELIGMGKGHVSKKLGGKESEVGSDKKESDKKNDKKEKENEEGEKGKEVKESAEDEKEDEKDDVSAILLGDSSEIGRHVRSRLAAGATNQRFREVFLRALARCLFSCEPIAVRPAQH